MKIIVLLFFLPLTLFSQNPLPFNVGEYSSFDISFRNIVVGSAELEVQNNDIDRTGNSFHIIGKGRTAPFFDWFFKVRDVYETFFDTSNVRPKKFIRRISEGGFQKQQLYSFYHSDDLVLVEDTSYAISKTTQDMLSALFFARTFNKDSLVINKSFFIPIFMDEENFLLEVTYLHNEDILTEFGKISCLVFKPMMQEGRVFQDGEKMKIWISNDKNNLLIKVETEIWAGTINAIITETRNLKYPLSIIK